MENETSSKKQINNKKIYVIVVIFFIATALIFGGFFYFLLNQKTKNIQVTHETEIQKLKKQIADNEESYKKEIEDYKNEINRLKKENKSTTKINDLNKDVIIEGWGEYIDNDFGIRFIHPNYWKPVTGNLNKFIPDFNYKINDGSFDVGTFENKNNLSIKEWVDVKDFFELKQYERPDAYIAHGLANNQPETIQTKDDLSVEIYFGGASGGGSFGTALFSKSDKIFVLAYTVVSFEDREGKKEVFKKIVRNVEYIK